MTTTQVMKLVCDIIQNQLGLDDDQVYLWNQDFIIPPDDRVYLIVALQSSKMFGSGSQFDGNMIETFSQNVRDILTIDIVSKSFDSIEDMGSVTGALRSTYSQQVQQLNGFYIANLPQQINTVNELEGTTILYRFNFPIAVQYFKEESSQSDYYDKFGKVSVTQNL